MLARERMATRTAKRARRSTSARKTGSGTSPLRPVPQAPLLNREINRLDYNRRVLAEARNPDVPPLERLKFIAYTAKNLDEFFMVRVGELRGLIDAGIDDPSPDGLTPAQQLGQIRVHARELIDEMYACLNDDVLPLLRTHGVSIERFDGLTAEEKARLGEYFDRHIAPVLTPLAIDPGHPFPFLANLSVNIAVKVESPDGEHHVVLVKLPPTIPRFVEIARNRFITVGNLVLGHVDRFFPTLEVRSAARFRLIRNADVTLHQDEIEDLRESVKAELRRLERSAVVCIEVEPGIDEDILGLLARSTGTSRDDIYHVPGIPRLADLAEIYEKVVEPSLRDPSFNPRIPQDFASTDDIFSILRKRDVLLHRPYESFTTVIEFLHCAAFDPNVLAIKQTLYQTDEGSPIIEKLIAAAYRGKQVTAVIELQARFEEQKNIEWARRLEEAGVQVVFGLVGLKTHCKVCLVVRSEGDELKRYVHLSTGNYAVATARSYTDIDLLTARASFGVDVATLFNLLTGYSSASVQEVFESSRARPEWTHLVVAPFDYQKWVIEMIEREAAHAAAGREARIIGKFNSFADPTIARALYAASVAGVKIDLIVRGICALVPGLPGISENIRVISIVDRFLEHSRILYLHNGGEPEVFALSGDWMERNFRRRIEIAFPIVDKRLKRRVIEQILGTCLTDNVKAWELGSDGKYRRRQPGKGEEPLRSQQEFIDIARAQALRVGPYEKSIREADTFRKKVRKPRSKKG
jgi:polyphosphate kinase